MLMPKRAKYRKVQRGRMTGTASRGNKVAYGEFGIQALEPGWITGNQIEAARIAMTRYTKRGGKVWIKIFPDKPYSKKGLGTPPQKKPFFKYWEIFGRKFWKLIELNMLYVPRSVWNTTWR